MNHLLSFLPDPSIAQLLATCVTDGRSVFVVGDPTSRRRLWCTLVLMATAHLRGHNLLITPFGSDEGATLTSTLSDGFFGFSSVLDGTERGFVGNVRAALRMDPDVIVVAGLQREDLGPVLMASATGHAVYAECDARSADTFFVSCEGVFPDDDLLVLTVDDGVIRRVDRGITLTNCIAVEERPAKPGREHAFYELFRRYRCQQRHLAPRQLPEPRAQRSEPPQVITDETIAGLRNPEREALLRGRTVATAWLPVCALIDHAAKDAVDAALPDTDELLIASIAGQHLPPELSFACPPGACLQLWFAESAVGTDEEPIRLVRDTTSTILSDLIRENYHVTAWEPIAEIALETDDDHDLQYQHRHHSPCFSGTKLGGRPCWEQGDETPACADCGAPMSMLFQWRSCDDMFRDFYADFSFYLFCCPDHPERWRTVCQCG